MKFKYFLLILAPFLFGGCTQGSGLGIIDLQQNITNTTININNEICMNCTSLWEFDNATQYIQPTNFEENKTVRVYDLVIESPNSLVIGGIENGTPFATISAQEINSISRNISRKFVTTQRDFIIFNDYNGTAFLVSGNQNLEPNSSSFVSASDPEGNGMLISKYNLNHDEPYNGQLVNLFGDMDMMTKKNNTGSLLNDSKENSIRLGFYDDIISGDEISVFGYTGVDYAMTLNQTEINNHYPTSFDTVAYFNETYRWDSTNASLRTAPPPKPNHVALFARDNRRLFIKSDNGNVRRLVTANTGSLILDEEMIVNNHTTFKGDVTLDNAVYNGGTIGYACIDGYGKIFKSVDPCHTTTDRAVNSTILDPNLGEENN